MKTAQTSAIEHAGKVSQARNKRKPRAIIYCRVSTEKQKEDGESLEYQEQKGKQYAELHDIEIIAVLKEVKSGYIHYAHREQLSLARQAIQDGIADMIIVWDLRRFSRNFVHSAMIFEEIEGAGGTVVSISENIDNSLTGKLIRSIMAWSAESERHKIVEYANRRWQTRIESDLPVGTGFAPYGWKWGDETKTSYVIDPEAAAVRFSIFQMFVELDMSLRSIAHKLTEDGIPTATQTRNPGSSKGMTWSPATIIEFLKDQAVVGVLVICKQKRVLAEDGSTKSIPHPNRKEIPRGIPAIVSWSMYERAQRKLAANREEKSHLPENPEEYLLKGHLYCSTCGYKMGTRKHHGLPYYNCRKFINNYSKCPDRPVVRIDQIDQFVWEDCCRLFERLDRIQARIEQGIEQFASNLLEGTQGQEQIQTLQIEIDYAEQERSRHPEGSYYYNLITNDIQTKTEQLQKYQEECSSASAIATATSIYKERVLEFLEFLNVMQGDYQNATFQQKRNALDVLGVKASFCKQPDGKKNVEVTYAPPFTVPAHPGKRDIDLSSHHGP